MFRTAAGRGAFYVVAVALALAVQLRLTWALAAAVRPLGVAGAVAPSGFDAPPGLEVPPPIEPAQPARPTHTDSEEHQVLFGPEQRRHRSRLRHATGGDRCSSQSIERGGRGQAVQKDRIGATYFLLERLKHGRVRFKRPAPSVFSVEISWDLGTEEAAEKCHKLSSGAESLLQAQLVGGKTPTS